MLLVYAIGNHLSTFVKVKDIFRTYAYRMAAIDPGGDEALELARLGLVSTTPVSYRYEAAQSKVVDAWASRLVANAGRSVKFADTDDVLGEARMWMLEQLKEFRPTDAGGTVAVFVRARQNWFRSKVRRGSNEGAQSHGRHVVGYASGRAREEFLNKFHREPTAEELKMAVTALLTAQSIARCRVKSDASKSPLSESDLITLAHSRLSKDGVLAALDNFDDVRRDSLPPVALQILVDQEDDAPRWGVALPYTVDPDFDAIDEELVFERLLLVALGDQQWARVALSARIGETSAACDAEPESNTLRDLADTAKHSVADLREVLASVGSRVSAPHAQWAYLASSLTVSHHLL